MNTATVGLAVTPTALSTLLTHYLNRKPLAHKPTAHLSYDEGLHLIRSFLTHASHHTVEELQAFTSQWVPHPQWVKVDHVVIPEEDLLRAADLLVEQLGPDGIRQVGGKAWWQWRKPNSPLKAEWIEMKADYQERKRGSNPGNRVMLYVHGGAYYFGSVDDHRYQIQRHARKLKARALAPRYRLAPQFPFPCGLQDCLATYLYLITHQHPSTVILAGDSAGGGMILSMMVILRDRGIPLPAGAVLISPWVDLTHSFPSVAGHCPLDYLPPSGFHHKPSRAWPPPDEEELAELKKVAMAQKNEIYKEKGEPAEEGGIPRTEDVAQRTHRLTFLIDGEQVDVKEQIQIYTTNELIAHPLVSPIMQPTLGGLPPLLIMVGGGEMLRDEQIYLAHKCADPARYLPPETMMDDRAKTLVDRYKPTDVQLQVWDDLCHVAPTLSFTRPAKFMFRSVAQFSAWALARAQKTEVEIVQDDEISVISSSTSSDESEEQAAKAGKQRAIVEDQPAAQYSSVGRAGDPLPPFENHMIRQRVTRHGDILPLPPPSELPGCCMARDQVGVVKVGTLRKWLEHKKRWDARFKQTRARVHKKRLRDMATGYEVFGDGEVPPPSALAGRRKLGARELKEKKARGLGLSLWALWGSKHDEMTVQREQHAAKTPEATAASASQGQNARTFSDLEKQERAAREGKGMPSAAQTSNSQAWTNLVGADQAEKGDDADKSADLGPAGPVSHSSSEAGAQTANHQSATALLSPDDAYETGVTGKRVIIGGLATPFSLRKEPETASMITLATPMDQRSTRVSTADSSSVVAAPSAEVSEDQGAVGSGEPDKQKHREGETPGTAAPFVTPFLTPASPGERPPLDRFVTAEEGAAEAGA
ncbi:43b7cf72-dd7d-4f9a-a1d8-e77a0d63de04 [Thermothielavioides terrestris]|uniref:43b7cf72-dd7d-4f9a-a1d8-e77a0d63de04 n=1 Tax=Thermothielavioides terrestris TaxID=2587410 RepID=A0A446BL06_9PEZI|nr:43b7cf72-dd7d-4f9a-a1d8-e77a0d63de04 [Thermothielavioides terrestris]